MLSSETCVIRLLEEQEKHNAKQKNTKKTQKKSQDDDCDEMDDLDSEDSEEKDENKPGGSLDTISGDYVKIIQRYFVGYHACVEENASNNMFHIQCFKSQFGKYVVNEGDTDIRDKDDSRIVSAKIDGCSRSRVILETEGSIRKTQKRSLFHYKTVKNGTPNLTSPFIHGFFTIVFFK